MPNWAEACQLQSGRRYRSRSCRKSNDFVGEKRTGPEASIAKQEYLPNDNAGKLFFIDVPHSKQSVLLVGRLALAADHADAPKFDFANEILGGGSSGRLFQTLRIEKGYTYGAYSGVPSRKEIAPFIVRSSVRANATLPSLEIIQKMIQDYGPNFTENEVELTKNKIVKQNTRAYESANAKLNILDQIDSYGKSLKYIEEEQALLQQMQRDDFQRIITEYIPEEEMVYVVVGDKASQWDEVKKFGKEVIELDLHGKPKSK